MDNKPLLIKYKIPSFASLIKEERREVSEELDKFNALLQMQPPEDWIKELSYIPKKNGRAFRYLPIDKTEYLLRVIFKDFRIQVLGSATAFNGVTVTVRVHYLHPITDKWSYHDGIGADALQHDKDSSVADLSKIKDGAIAMSYPTAKSLAIKDACDHFGNLFGGNLNRMDVVDFIPDTIPPPIIPIPLEIEVLIAEAQLKSVLIDIFKEGAQYHNNPAFMQMLNKRKIELNGNITK